MYVPSTIPTACAISRMQPWGSKLFLGPSRLCMWLNPVKTSIQALKIPASGCRDLVLWPLKTNLCVSSLTYQSCHIPIWSGLCLSLASSCPVYRGEFQISPRKLSRFWINDWWTSQVTEKLILEKGMDWRRNSKFSLGFHHWPLCGEGAHMLGSCQPSHQYRDSPQMLDSLMHLFEELCIVHGGKKRKGMNGCHSWLASTVGN